MKFKFLALILTIIFTTNLCIAKTLKTDAKTKRIPAGTNFSIQLLEPVTTVGSDEGDYFSAMLIDDKKTPTSVILPAGSIIRGSLDKIVPSKRLSRGGILYLEFDHIVTPNGRQLPLNMVVSGPVLTNLNGGIYFAKGYGEALQNNWEKTVDITKTSTEKGIEMGSKVLNGVGNIITVPICALGGSLGGGLYLVGDSIADLFKKGADVTLNQGSKLVVVLTQPIDVPIN